LARRSAQQRSHTLTKTRTLTTPMQMLRAQEQIDGVMPHYAPFVQVPNLGLKCRVLVTNSGDDDYNGIYFCTSGNGNGYIFTKPRLYSSSRSMSMRSSSNNNRPSAHNGVNDDNGEHKTEDNQDANSNLSHSDHITTQQNLPLRCLISKRFSEQTLLWYMSKELERRKDDYELMVEDSHDSNEEQPSDEEFGFYANLMAAGWASPGMSHYPSQTSILSLHGDGGWQSLSEDLHPPTVELLP
jgi:hypothetical protein